MKSDKKKRRYLDNPEREFLTMKEVRSILQIGQGTLYRLMDNDPEFRTLKIGGRRLMRKSALNDYILLCERRESQARGHPTP